MQTQKQKKSWFSKKFIRNFWLRVKLYAATAICLIIIANVWLYAWNISVTADLKAIEVKAQTVSEQYKKTNEELNKKLEPKTVKEQVYKLLTDNGLSFDEVVEFMAVIKCESNFNQYAINKNKDGSFDLGLFQINTRIHGKSIDRASMFDIASSTNYAIQLYRKHGLKPWMCNK